MLEQLKIDHGELTLLQHSFGTKYSEYLETQIKHDSILTDNIDTETRTSTEKQVLALRQTNSEFNDTCQNLLLLKGEVEGIKTKISIIKTKIQLSDLIHKVDFE